MTCTAAAQGAQSLKEGLAFRTGPVQAAAGPVSRRRSKRDFPFPSARPPIGLASAGKKIRARGSEVVSMVGTTGFEPAASCSQSRRATKLRHVPDVLGIEGTEASLDQSFGDYRRIVRRGQMAGSQRQSRQKGRPSRRARGCNRLVRLPRKRTERAVKPRVSALARMRFCPDAIFRMRFSPGSIVSTHSFRRQPGAAMQKMSDAPFPH